MVEKTQWKSSSAFILAMIGAAVGLGNIWRFSYVVYSNGGGSFFIPYLIAIAIMGIPFLILEYGMGFSFKDSFSNTLKRINPKLEYISWILLLFVFIVVLYYMVILSWDLVYLGSSFTFQWGSDAALTGTPMVQLVSKGTGLIFIVFPMIFNIMGLAGRILAPLLFIAILFAGISSAVAIFEPMVSSIENKLDWTRKKTVTVLSVIGCLLSLIFTTGISSYLVGVVDVFVNEFGVLLLIAIQCIIFTWIYDVDSLIPILNENSRFKVGKTWKFIIKYVLPFVLIIMWLIRIIHLFEDADSFEITVDIIIMAVVLVFGVIFTKIKPKGELK